MSTVPNHALRQLRAGKLAIGLGVAQARTVGIATIAKTAGFDWLFIDGEHSSLDADTAAQIATASLAVGVTPVVRVAGMEHWHASRMLDNGAQGIVFPHVDDAVQARRCADACRYPPVGKRGQRHPHLEAHQRLACRARTLRNASTAEMVSPCSIWRLPSARIFRSASVSCVAS